MPDKPKIALYWCAGCGGCEESVVDLAESILDVLAAVDIVFWPVALDFKRADVERMADASIAASLVNGAVRTSEQEEMVRLLRRKSQLLIAYGACAHLGGIPGLANQFSREQIMEYVYFNCPTVDNPAKLLPSENYVDQQERVVALPEFRRLVRTLRQIVPVDYTIPGCPPTPALLGQALGKILAGDLPPKGSVLAPDVALCGSCPRRDSKPEQISHTALRRPHLTALDPSLCFLAQGVLCMGPATRGGCEAACISGAMPCTGCFGGTSRVRDQGAKMLSSYCSAIAGEEPDAIDSVLDGLPDPVGTLYRYGLPGSLLRARVNAFSVN